MIFGVGQLHQNNYYMKTQSRKPIEAETEFNNEPVETRLYHFPDIAQLGQQFTNVNQINQKLDILLKNHNLLFPNHKIQKTLVTRQVEGGYLFRCKLPRCSAFLKFQYLGDGRLMLSKSDIQHQHKLSTRLAKGRLPKIKNSQVQQCYDELQLLNFKPGQILNFIRIRFKITKAHYYAIKYGRNKRETIRNLLMTLSKYDHFFFQCKDLQELAAYYRNQRFKPQKKQDRDVLIVISRKMKQSYEKYHGQYVLFSVFPELVLETRYSKRLKYHHVCVLYGQDASGNNNLLFAVIFMRKSIRLAYLYILEKIFTFLGKYPKVLITDYEPHLAQAVRRLQKRVTDPLNSIKLHLQLPNSFITNNFQSRTSPQFLSILSNQLQPLLRQSDRNKHEQRLNVIMKACELNPPATQQRIAQQIRKYVKGNSIIYLPPHFIGLSVTPYSTAAYLRSRVLDFFKSPRQMVLSIKAFFQIFKAYPVLKYLTREQIDARLNPPKQCVSKKQKLQLLTQVSKLYQSTTRLKSITKALSQQANLCFYDALQKCFLGNLQLINHDGRVSYRVIQTKQNFPYVIVRVIEARNGEKVKLWRCNCHYFAKTGLPCWHQIKVCIQQKCSMIPQVSSFWFKDSKEKRGRGNYGFGQDVKYWNEGQNLKLGAESRQKHENIQHLQVQPQNYNNNHEDTNKVYNIKISHNNEDIYSDNNEDNEGFVEGPGEADWNNKRVNQKNEDMYYDEDQDNQINESEYTIKKQTQNANFGNNKLKSLKANNHSNQNQNYFNSLISEDSRSNYRQIAKDMRGLDNRSISHKSSNIWNGKQSNYDLKFSRAEDFQSSNFIGKTNNRKFQEWISELDEQNQEEHIIDNESAVQNEVVQVQNSQDSQQQWQRKSLQKINSKTANNLANEQIIDVADEDLNMIDFDILEDDYDQAERYIQLDKDYFSTGNNQ